VLGYDDDDDIDNDDNDDNDYYDDADWNPWEAMSSRRFLRCFFYCQRNIFYLKGSKKSSFESLKDKKMWLFFSLWKWQVEKNVLDIFFLPKIIKGEFFFVLGLDIIVNRIVTCHFSTFHINIAY